jgi:hypothetical protein
MEVQNKITHRGQLYISFKHCQFTFDPELLCKIWYCTAKGNFLLGKVNMELQLDATIPLTEDRYRRKRSAKEHARKPLHTTSQDIVPYVVKNLSL